MFGVVEVEVDFDGVVFNSLEIVGDVVDFVNDLGGLGSGCGGGWFGGEW